MLFQYNNFTYVLFNILILLYYSLYYYYENYDIIFLYYNYENYNIIIHILNKFDQHVEDEGI